MSTYIEFAKFCWQRPDLFGCALAHVGVMDMLRFHKFTIGESGLLDLMKLWCEPRVCYLFLSFWVFNTFFAFYFCFP